MTIEADIVVPALGGLVLLAVVRHLVGIFTEIRLVERMLAV